jgi:integrase
MAVGKVTVSALNNLNGWLWDSAVQGFGARRQRNGVYFYVRYRANGSQVVRSLGRLGALTPDTARAKARQLLGTVAGGVDPFASSSCSETFATAIDFYLERKRASLKPGSFSEIERYLRRYSAQLHRLNLGDIDQRNIAIVLNQIEQSRGPVARNRARSALSAFWTWAIQEALTKVNPVAGTRKADEAGSRERVLTQDELRKLWAGLGGDAFSNIVRLLLLTGARRNEIGRLSWPEVNLANRQIVLPADRCKNGREHTIPLSTQALAIIEGIPRRNSSAYLFSDHAGYNDWDRAKARLDARVPIAPWTLHDLRRTCATMMAELGVQPNVIEIAINHVSGHKAGVAGIYNRSKMTDAVRDGLQKWADHLDKIKDEYA